MLLPREIFEFRHASVELLVRVIHDGRRLKSGHVVCFVFEFKRSIRQFSVTIIKIRINWACIDHFREGNIFFYFAIIAVQHDLDVRMIKHVLEHARKTVQRHSLVRIGKVTIVTVRARRDSRSYAGVELRRVEPPLFACVVAKELLVQLAAHFADDDVLGRLYVLDGLGNFLKEVIDFNEVRLNP